jgi:hypothetical protein
LFIPNAENPGASTLAYSGHDMNTLNHILSDQWLQSANVIDMIGSEKVVVKILDHMGRETEFKANTPLIYVYADGTTKKIFAFGE